MKLVNRRKLYGFDGGKEHQFIEITFKNTMIMNKIKNLWFDIKQEPKYSKRLKRDGLIYTASPGLKNLMIYETNIPPLCVIFTYKKFRRQVG